MPRSGGTYSVPTTLVAGTTALASDMNTNFSDIGTEITNSVAVDGQSTLTGQLKAANGSVSAPGITFGADADSGIYRIGANNIGIGVNGAVVLDIATTGLTLTGTLTPSGQIVGAAGTVSAPGYSFASDLDSGMYRIGANNVGIGVNGAVVLDIGTAGLTLTGTLTPSGQIVATGSVSAPAYSFASDLDTGSYRIGANNYGIAVNGTKIVDVATTGITVTGTITPTGAYLSTEIAAPSTPASGFGAFYAGTDSLPYFKNDAGTAMRLDGGKVLITAQDASSSATIDFTVANSASAFDGTYDHLELVISSAKPATDDVEAWLRVGTGAGPTYQTSGYYYATQMRFSDDTEDVPASKTATSIKMSSTDATDSVGSATGESFCGVIRFNDPDASDFPKFTFEASYDAARSELVSVLGAGKYNTAGAITAIRFLFESGNIASGHFALYGYRRA